MNGNGKTRSSLWHRFAEPYALVGVWIAAALAFSLAEPSTFATWSNVQVIFSSQTVLLMLALALVVSLSGGEFDLSVGAVMAFTQALVAYLVAVHGWPIGAAIVAMLLASILIGAINAIVIVGWGVPSLVMTLGMATVLLGLSIGIASPEARGLPDPGFVSALNHQWLGLPVGWYIALALTVAVYYVLEQTPLGRYIRFVGANTDVARLNGIRVDSVRTLTLIGSSLIAGAAGIVLVGTQGSADVTVGASDLLPAFAAAFLGATAIKPGRFNAWGTFVAVYFLVTGTTGFQLLGLSSWVSEVFYGLTLIIAVAAARLAVRARNRAERQRVAATIAELEVAAAAAQEPSVR